MVIYLKLNKFCYRYSVIPAALVVATNMLFFYVLRPLVLKLHLHSVVLPIDEALPFVPGFIYIYFLAFLQWFLCYLVLLIEDKKLSMPFLLAASVSNVICGIFFFVFPTVMVGRPEITGSGFTNNFIRFVFSADNPPVNLFPSIHCFESWMCVRQLFASKKTPGFVKWINLVFTLFVFASVLLVKQHALLDVPAGILTAEAAILIVKKTGLYEKAERLERKIWKIKGE